MNRLLRGIGQVGVCGLLWAATATAVSAAPRAPAAPPPVLSAADLQKTVEGLLMGYEPADPAATLQRLGPPATEVLLRLAQDPSVPPLRRLRAIEALGHAPTVAALGYLRQLVTRWQHTDDGLGTYELAAAARALAGYAAAVPDLVGLLAHQSADVREGAAVSLARLRTPAAIAALRARLQTEREPGVRAVLVRAVR